MKGTQGNRFSDAPDEPQVLVEQNRLSSAIMAWTLELAPQGVFTTDTELRLTSWNQWLETHAHLKAEQVLGKPLVEVVPSLAERRLDHYYRDALHGESKLLSRSLHGYLLPLAPSVPSPGFAHMQQSARIGPLLLEGKICGTITLIEDVTERAWHDAVRRQARQRSELLARTLARLVAAREPEELVREIFSQIAGPLALDCCMYYLLDPHTQQIQFHSATGLSCAEQEQCAVSGVVQCLCRTILQTKQQVVVNHLQQRRDPNAQPCRNLGLTAFAGYPLLVGQRFLGSLAFGSRSRDSFSEEDVQFLFTVSQYAAVALDRARQENNLRASEERFRNMADTVPDIIFTAGPDGSRDYVSPRFYEVTGLPPGSGLGFGWMQAIDPGDVERVQRAWQHSAEAREPYSMEYRLRDKWGRARWFFSRARPIHDSADKIVKWFGTMTEIQELKEAHEELGRAQAKLVEHAADLEKKVDERTAELRESVSQLESFSYTVAHDVRAPIRAIEHHAAILLEDYGSRLEEPAKKVLSNISRAARRLDALTRDVLNYTKVATQRAELVPVDPTEVLHDVLVMNPALQTPNAEVAIVHPMIRVLANPTLLSQCFSNLLSNAIKFVNAGVTPHIVIGSEPIQPERHEPASEGSRTPTDEAQPPPRPLSATEGPTGGDRVRLWVQDNGIGIEPRAHPKIFGIFERGRGVERIPGTGIGLAIVARAVERMNGRYGIESKVGEGSRFWIELTAA